MKIIPEKGNRDYANQEKAFDTVIREIHEGKLRLDTIPISASASTSQESATSAVPFALNASPSSTATQAKSTGKKKTLQTGKILKTINQPKPTVPRKAILEFTNMLKNRQDPALATNTLPTHSQQEAIDTQKIKRNPNVDVPTSSQSRQFLPARTLPSLVNKSETVTYSWTEKQTLIENATRSGMSGRRHAE